MIIFWLIGIISGSLPSSALQAKLEALLFTSVKQRSLEVEMNFYLQPTYPMF